MKATLKATTPKRQQLNIANILSSTENKTIELDWHSGEGRLSQEDSCFTMSLDGDLELDVEIHASGSCNQVHRQTHTSPAEYQSSTSFEIVNTILWADSEEVKLSVKEIESIERELQSKITIQ